MAQCIGYKDTALSVLVISIGTIGKEVGKELICGICVWQRRLVLKQLDALLC